MEPPDRRRAHGAARLVVMSLVVGTALRVGAVALSTPEYNPLGWELHSWPADHGAYVQWARQATSPEQGLWTLYTQQPKRGIKVRLSIGERQVRPSAIASVNYPPLGVYLLYVEGLLHARLDRELVANTLVARFVFSLFSLIGDIILAWGVLRLAGLMFGARAGSWAFAAAYLIPPVWLDSCWWGQTDSWMLAPAVWIVWAMVERRWLLAGGLWGVALSLKPQAILLGPVWVFALAASLTPTWHKHFAAHARRDAVRIVLAVVSAIIVLNITALPFWLTSGDAWVRQSYLRNFSSEAPHTTLQAFNLWYVDLLLTYDTDVTQTIAGVTKERWGQLLTAVGLVVSAAVAWRTGWPVHRRIAVFIGLWLMIAVMAPTRVHERYILLCLPFLIVAALRLPRMWPGLVGLIVVACLQLTVHNWCPLGADQWSRELKEDTIRHHRDAVAQTPLEYRDRLPSLDEAIQLRFEAFAEARRPYEPFEWTLTVVALLSTVAVFVGAHPRKRGSDGQETAVARHS